MIRRRLVVVGWITLLLAAACGGSLAPSSSSVVPSPPVRFSANRLVAGYKGRWLLESEETHSYNSGCCTYVIQMRQSESRLTPSGVENERAVTMLGDGSIVAFRPDGDGPDGTMVIYSATGGRVERTDRGAFTPFQIVRTGSDWILGFEYAGAPALTLRAYRVSDGAFAAAAGGTISAVAIFPAK